jgi:hypothetical protein
MTNALIEKAQALLEGRLQYYGHHWHQVGSPPAWFRDPWSGRVWSETLSHWSQIDEFATSGADIKAVWEPSRFEWMVLLARAYSLTGTAEFLATLCAWLDDWIDANPVNAGVNWKCGQETSLRLLRFLEALESLEWPREAHEPVMQFVLAHLQRIDATVPYALAQQNNHGTSEAAALFVGGHWLLEHGLDRARNAHRFAKRGRKLLVNRILRLVSPDGTFSQYSVNYHRMLLDTISLVEAWRRRLTTAPVFEDCKQRIEAAIDWLWTFTDPVNGDAPNLGGNDGTALLIAPGSPYRDHRPSLQLAAALLRGRCLYPPGPWNEPLRQWALSPEELPLDTRVRESRTFMQGGFAALLAGRSWALLRLPRFRFRPSHADALHLDLWVAGENVVRDTGSYSYNATAPVSEYFSGTRGHSTCEFDGRDQMKRAGRFLFSHWLSMAEFRFNHADTNCGVSSAYQDHWGAWHRRSVQVSDSTWTILDEVAGFSVVAVIRWHLAPGEWQLSGRSLRGRGITLHVDCNEDCRVSLDEGWESREYMQRAPLPVLKIEIPAPRGRLRTLIRIAS